MTSDFFIPQDVPGRAGTVVADASEDDPVNSPAHYTQGKIEVIEFIQDQKLSFCEGNVVKYVARAEHKGKQLEDLRKARWYLSYRIKELEGNG